MSEFEHRHHGYGDLVITGFGNDPFEKPFCVPACSFGGNSSGRIEDQSQAGGFSYRYMGRNENFVLVTAGHAAILRPTACSSDSRSSQTR